jgi:hypothetical protein
MKKVKYGPFDVSLRVDDDGEWRVSAERNGRELFSDVTYSEVTLACILLDQLVAQELGIKDDDDDSPRDS